MKVTIFRRQADAVCRAVAAQLEAYCDRELDTARASAVTDHLTSCEACRTEHRAMTVSRGALSGFPRIATSSDFDSRVLERVLNGPSFIDTWLDTVDSLFTRPLSKVLGTALLSVVLGMSLVMALGGPSRLQTAALLANEPRHLSLPDFTTPDGDDSLERWALR